MSDGGQRRQAGQRARAEGDGERRPRRRQPLTRDEAWEYLLRVLARQSYTVAELRRKLAQRGVDDGTAEALVVRLQDLRLVDDASYTEQYVASRKSSRGRLALGQELRRKGIDDTLALEHLGSLSPEQQLEAATALLHKNAWRYRPRSDEPRDPDEGEFEALTRMHKARSKALAFLARRGFSGDAAQAALTASGWFDEE